FEWLAGCLTAPPRRWANLHAGLDETSAAIAALFPAAEGRVLDIYDGVEMTERSIAEARRLGQPARASEPADFRAAPLPDSWCDTAVVIFAAHELRRHASRVRLFSEVARSLRPGGEMVLVEHLRDGANFLAFGPGALHFFSGRAWRRAAREAGLKRRTE